MRISETIGQTSSSLVWGQTEIVYAWNVVAMTGAFVQPGDQSAAASLGLAATSERKVVICGHWLGQVVEERLWV